LAKKKIIITILWPQDSNSWPQDNNLWPRVSILRPRVVVLTVNLSEIASGTRTNVGGV